MHILMLLAKIKGNKVHFGKLVTSFGEGGGGGILRIQMRKVKDFANNASILAIFLLKLCNFSQNFLLIMQFFAYWLCFSSFTENFPYFFAKYPHFGQNF